MKVYPLKILQRFILSVAGLGLLLSISGYAARPPHVEHKVYVAFGFHVNLSHSFRNDTDDAYGFGKDISVIRSIIGTLDRYNRRGVPVKGIWDFDNLFSLQERLPRYAPDIIRNIRRRVAQRKDEVILMSYNNGLASAMTRRELTDAMKWAVSNPWGSGVKDLFGRYSPIVRPQEMMTTPGDFEIYKQQGIKAVALYYSATPFDAFRTFVRPLSREEAYNPITYKNPQTHEEMTVIPTYNIGDLLENVSLGHWVGKLRKLQEQGRIDHDVLIYINYDADSEFWRGLDLAWPLDRLPNAGGLAALVDEVKDLPYVAFTTLQDYLDDHPPVGSFYFGQDTADGSFNGYNSWAEKFATHGYWTRIEYYRRIHKAAAGALALFHDPALEEKTRPLLDAFYRMRMRALSTTNFGMATPYLSIGRERAVATLMERMDVCARRIKALMQSGARKHFRALLHAAVLPAGYRCLDTFMLIGVDNKAANGRGRFLDLYLPAPDAEVNRLLIMKPDGQRTAARVINCSHKDATGFVRMKLYVGDDLAMTDGIYYLLGKTLPQAAAASTAPATRSLKNARVELHFGAQGTVEGLFIDGVQKLDAGSLMPYFRYRNKVIPPDRLRISPMDIHNGVASVKMQGILPGPRSNNQMPGEISYQFSLVDDLPYLFVDGILRFPLTRENDLLKANLPALARRTDMGWQEAAPLELRFSHHTDREDPVRILKQNYLGIRSDYALDYYKRATGNLSLDDVNNHITAAYFGIVAGGHGIAVATDTHVQANFAFAPVKMHFDEKRSAFFVSANPFGTYHGRQYGQPTWGNRQGYELSVITGEQFHSAAPTYNGTSTSFSAMLAFFDGDAMPLPVEQNLIRFAKSPVIISLRHDQQDDDGLKKLSPPAGFEAIVTDGGVYFRWQKVGTHVARYRVYCGSGPASEGQVSITTRNGLMMHSLGDGKKFKEGRTYYARVEAVRADGTVSAKSRRIAFAITPVHPHAYPPKVSLNLKFRVLWTNIAAYLGRHVI